VARILGARLSSFVGLTEVVFGFVVAWLALGELPTAVQLLGGALIVAGVALVRADELRPPATRRVPHARRLEPSLDRQDG
jgi:drug/metabolite transporter (DMT)-like permease